ncbi:MAG: LysE/ArgO family amino acid transporter [Micrococcaceae bacterium]|nr:LysE/ArgO family amino acid transporter [Micrococcaceae bacterium]MDN5822962.1 LysE/ArgO family amino acid transporter [Micrococcaceae bacterium]MDN5878633.1 LysE/ArgO family amino acid transporter [Micrococcaceae bacterium]MDN5886117.1 LysE/ArgO family amino acid transporter [Micrococcaceae bacterium]MDN5905324.1 LysE/ArgO family amino acid transporter [Micrococcaceae bacterium]
MTYFPSLLAGLGSGLALIIAIGAQNAFILRQGIRREHVLGVVLICALSDAVLIFAGVAGVGALVATAPWLLVLARWAGAAFLVGYAFVALRRVVRPAALTVDRGTPGTTRRSVLATAAALTWLNPHVYLDTMILLGTIASAHGDPGRWIFAAGAVLGSFLWFPALGFGARLLAGFFARPGSWRVLDGLVAAVMLLVAISLLTGP